VSGEDTFFVSIKVIATIQPPGHKRKRLQNIPNVFFESSADGRADNGESIRTPR
jgi:hypothetical protein